MRVRDLIEQLEHLDPDMPVLSGAWDRSRQQYVNLREMDTIQTSTRVVTRHAGVLGTHYLDNDPGGGIDADHPEVLIL